MINDYKRYLGNNPKLFTSAVNSIKKCVMYNTPHTYFFTDSDICISGTNALIVSKQYYIWTVNPIRIVVAGRFTDGSDTLYRFVAGTLPGHEEQGEECFTVRETEFSNVWYNVFSFYKPSRIITKLCIYFIKRVVNRFTADSFRAVQQYCNSGSEQIN
jgi:uncharacterized protein (UPF0548 family)